MTIGILTQYFPPEVGAPQARLSALAARFVEHGHTVHILTAMPNYPTGQVYPGYKGVLIRETTRSMGITRTYIYPTKSVGVIKRLANYFSFVVSSALVGMVLLPRLDYLLTESPPLFLGISGYVLSRVRRARWIFNVSDLWPESALRLGVVREGVALRAAVRLEEACYRNAWLVSCQSLGILANIQTRFPNVRTYHLSNGVDTNLFTPQAKAESSRVHGERGECIILYAGLHGIAQGLGQVLDAARIVDGKLCARFVFVGDGPEKACLVARAREFALTNVLFLDPVPSHNIPALLSAADIAVIPLKLHLPGAVPSKLYEAMAAGVAVVLASDGEAAAIVRETACGVVVSPGDVAGLVSAIRMLTNSPSARATCGANGRRAVVERFDRKIIADGFIEYLKEQLHGANL